MTFNTFTEGVAVYQRHVSSPGVLSIQTIKDIQELNC